MKAELKPIIAQINDVAGMDNTFVINALMSEEKEDEIAGWSVFYVDNEKTIELPKFRCKTLTELFLRISVERSMARFMGQSIFRMLPLPRSEVTVTKEDVEKWKGEPIYKTTMTDYIRNYENNDDGQE